MLAAGFQGKAGAEGQSREGRAVCRILLAVGLVAGYLSFFGSPASAYRFDVQGRRFEVGVAASVREVVEENKSTQHERTQGKVRLVPRIDWSRNLRLSASILGIVGGPTMLAERGGVLHWRRVFQNLSPAVDFEEAYLDSSWGDFDLRLGKQRIAWGKLDRFSPVDVFNSLTYFDPFLVEEGERRIGTPAASATYSLSSWGEFAELRFTAVWAPIFLPYRFPTARCRLLEAGNSVCEAERWFPPAAVPPSSFVIPEGAFPMPEGGTSPALSVPLAFRVRNEAPRATLRDGSFGARLAATVRQVDLAAYYYHGYDPQPAFSFHAWALGAPDPNPANPLRVKNLVGSTFLQPVFKSIDLWGVDASHSRGDFVFRAEAAFVSGRPYAREVRSLLAESNSFAGEVLRALQDLARGAGATPVSLPEAFVTRSAFEWGAGVDYNFHGWLSILQLNQTNLLNNEAHSRLLIRDVETRVLYTLRKNLLGERLRANLQGGYGIDSSYAFARPRFTYEWNDWLSSEVGYLVIAGRRRSVIGQYRRNDEGWVTVSLRF